LIALLLADGRFPSGGHAHSGGLEAAVDDGRVVDVADLRAFLGGRLATAGRVAAAVAAAAAVVWPDPAAVADLDAETGARIASPALRHASRQQGRHLLRAARAVWPSLPEPDQLHHPVALGAVAATAGLATVEAARWAAYDAVAGPAGAAVRLLGLDPASVWAAVAALAPAVDELAAEAAAGAGTAADTGRGPGPRFDHLPACSAPLLEIGAERHALGERRLFAS
jgi:urease accessory protein